MTLVQSLLIMLVGMSLIGMSCFFGERLNSQCNKLRSELYNIKWYDQSTRFKKKVLIMQIMMNREIELRTIQFSMDRENLYKVQLQIF